MAVRKYAGWLIAAILALGYIWFLPTIYALRGEKEELLGQVSGLEDRLTGYQERLEKEATGGYETAVDPVSGDELVFPIAPEDYLMKTSAYGIRTSPFFNIEMKHEGLDVAGVWRAQVVAIADGTVIEHWPPPGTPHPSGGTYRGHPVYGGLVVIRHADGMVSRSGHLHSTRVFEGMRVRAGQVIGRQGATGLADGEHLHFELLVEGENVNPLHYLPEVP